MTGIVTGIIFGLIAGFIFMLGVTMVAAPGVPGGAIAVIVDHYFGSRKSSVE